MLSSGTCATVLRRSHVPTNLNPAVTSPIIGTRTPAQLTDNLGALDVDFDPAQVERLEAASAVALPFPHNMPAREMTQGVIHGDLTIAPRA